MSTTITTEMVKELRDATGVSIMQCRKALEESGGDKEKAIILLRKKGSEIADKKADRAAADGVIAIKQDGGRALTLILNCETDFVAKNEDFVALANKLLEVAWTDGAEAARAQAPTLINDVVLKIGENIQLGAIEEVTGETIGVYTHHNGKVASIVVLEGGSPEVARDIAMHAAAMRPRYITSDEISEADKAQVREVVQAEVEATDKPADMKAKILDGKLASYFKEQTLVDQPFFKTPEKTIGTYAQENNAKVAHYVLYTLG